MIICNPNLGFAEVQQYTSDWVDFYLNFGLNVVLWNYRGFSGSTGDPSPSALREDAEQVFLWAKEKTIRSVGASARVKVGVHGISIGGIAATHLGRIGAVEFLFLDRTFKDLLSILEEESRILPLLCRALTLWENPNNAEDFMHSQCYKVIAQDPRDEVI